MHEGCGLHGGVGFPLASYRLPQQELHTNMSSGKYNQRFVRLVGTVAQEGTYGGLSLEYTEGETLWGHFEDLRSYEQVLLTQVLGRVDTKIHLHNEPVIEDKDVLRDKVTGDLWHVVGNPTIGDNEVIVLAYKGENDDPEVIS